MLSLLYTLFPRRRRGASVLFAACFLTASVVGGFVIFDLASASLAPGAADGGPSTTAEIPLVETLIEAGLLAAGVPADSESAESIGRALAGALFFVVFSIAYFIVCVVVCGRRIVGESEFHDSFYFLGFIFTLVALAASVIILSGQFETGRGMADEEIAEVLVENVVALTSTIVGLVIRNVLSFATLRIGGGDDQPDTPFDKIERASERLPEIGASIDAVAGQIQRLAAESERMSGAVDAAADKMGGAAAAFETSAAQMQAATPPIAATLADAQASVEAAHRALAAVRREMSAIADDGAAAEADASQRLQTARERFDRHVRALDEALETAPRHAAARVAEAVDAQIKRDPDAIDALMARVGSEVERYEAALARAAEKLSATAELLDGALSQQSTAAGEWADRLSTEVDNLNAAARNITGGLTRLVEALHRDLEDEPDAPSSGVGDR